MVVAKGTKEFERPSTGSQVGICINIFDLGLQKTTFKGEDTGLKHQVVIRWELAQKMTEGNYAGQRFLITKKYTVSLHEKATLRKDLESWLGIAFTDSQILEGFDLDTLLGKSCLLGVAKTETGNVKVSTLMALPQGVAPIAQENDASSIPKWVQEAADTQYKTPDKFEDVPF